LQDLYEVPTAATAANLQLPPPVVFLEESPVRQHGREVSDDLANSMLRGVKSKAFSAGKHQGLSADVPPKKKPTKQSTITSLKPPGPNKPKPSGSAQSKTGEQVISKFSCVRAFAWSRELLTFLVAMFSFGSPFDLFNFLKFVAKCSRELASVLASSCEF
jgi:hypothetical protein